MLPEAQQLSSWSEYGGAPAPVCSHSLDGHRAASWRCHDRPMPASSAELSSLATALDELTRRVTVHGEAADEAKDEETARELFAIERSLTSANRRLARLALTLGRR